MMYIKPEITLYELDLTVNNLASNKGSCASVNCCVKEMYQSM